MDPDEGLPSRPATADRRSSHRPVLSPVLEEGDLTPSPSEAGTRYHTPAGSPGKFTPALHSPASKTVPPRIAFEAPPASPPAVGEAPPDPNGLLPDEPDPWALPPLPLVEEEPEPLALPPRRGRAAEDPPRIRARLIYNGQVRQFRRARRESASSSSRGRPPTDQEILDEILAQPDNTPNDSLFRDYRPLPPDSILPHGRGLSFQCLVIVGTGLAYWERGRRFQVSVTVGCGGEPMSSQCRICGGKKIQDSGQKVVQCWSGSGWFMPVRFFLR